MSPTTVDLLAEVYRLAASLTRGFDSETNMSHSVLQVRPPLVKGILLPVFTSTTVGDTAVMDYPYVSGGYYGV